MSIEKLLDEDLEKSAAYFETNELIINLKRGKTESMLFETGKRLAKTNKELEVIYRGQLINCVKEYKYLGNVLDQFLSFNVNLDKVYKKASCRLKLLARLKYYLTTDSAFYIFAMMIQPILTYCSTVKL